MAAEAAHNIAALTLQSLNEALQTLHHRHAQLQPSAFITALTPPLTENLSLLKAYLHTIPSPQAPPPVPPQQQQQQQQQQDALIQHLRHQISAQRSEARKLSARITAAKHLNSSLTALHLEALSSAVHSTSAQNDPVATKQLLSTVTQHGHSELRNMAAAAMHRVTRTQRLAAQMQPDSQTAITSGTTAAFVPSAAQVCDVANSQQQRLQHAAQLLQVRAHLLGHG